MAPPIILPSSQSHDALVDGIEQAVATNATLLLEPGTHYTRPGRAQRIAVRSRAPGTCQAKRLSNGAATGAVSSR